MRHSSLASALPDFPDSTLLETPACTCEPPNLLPPDEANAAVDAAVAPYTVGCVTPRYGAAIAMIGAEGRCCVGP